MLLFLIVCLLVVLGFMFLFGSLVCNFDYGLCWSLFGFLEF